MHPHEQLLLDHVEWHHALFLAPESDQLIQRIQQEKRPLLSIWKNPLIASETDYGLEITEERLENLKQLQVKQVYLPWPKSKDFARFLVNFCAHLQSKLGQELELWFYGGNKSGIKSIKNAIPNHLSLSKIASGKHSQLFALRVETLQSFQLSDYYSEFDLEGLKLAALPGVFSRGRLDKGTEVLLPFLPKGKGKALDYGCGCGVISLKLAQLGWHCEALDTDWLAITSTQESATRNELSLTTYASDRLLSSMPRYELIVSNPPFHEGTRTHYAATERFLADAKKQLKAGGQLLIVANNFLQYEEILKQHFSQVQQLIDQKGFKVLKAS